MNKAISLTMVDDDRVLATKWTLPPDTETGHHKHGMDYVVVYLKGGTLTVSSVAGEAQAAVVEHSLTSRAAGIEHNVMNKSDAEIEFIEIEIKRPTSV